MRIPSSMQRAPAANVLPLLLVLAVPLVSGCKGRERVSAGRGGGGDTTVAAASGAIANAPAQQVETAAAPSAAAPKAEPSKPAPSKPQTSQPAQAKSETSKPATPKPAPAETTGAAPAAAADTGAAAAKPAEPPFTFDPKKAASVLGVYAYPQKNQSTTQQQRDENECFTWAQKQTGIDFYAIAPTVDSAAATTKKGGTVRGAARGAAAGAAIGAIAGDAGTGAGIGAVGGAVAGRRQQKAGEQATKQQAEQQANAEVAQQEQTFKNAFSACMQGRNYSVK